LRAVGLWKIAAKYLVRFRANSFNGPEQRGILTRAVGERNYTELRSAASNYVPSDCPEPESEIPVSYSLELKR